MPKRYHDTEQEDKDWKILMPDRYKLLLLWIEKKHDPAGFWSWQLATFCRHYPSFNLHPKDFDPVEFAEYCNYGDKERIMVLDGGKTLFYTTTIEFQEGGKTKTTKLTANWNHTGIFQRVCAYKETRDWMVSRIAAKKIEVSSKLLSKIIEDRDKEGNHYYPEKAREYAIGLAKMQGMERESSQSENDKIKKRDGYTCQYCQQTGSPGELEVDHIIPRSEGGDKIPGNKVTACKSCNATKRDKNVFEYIMEAGVVPTDALQQKLAGYVKKQLLHYPSDYPLGKGIGIGKGIDTCTDRRSKEVISKKEKKKKSIRTYTHAQVMSHLNRNPGHTMDSHFELVKRKDETGPALWVMKKGPP